MEKGEFDRIFLDAYQILKQKVNTGMDWIYKSIIDSTMFYFQKVLELIFD